MPEFTTSYLLSLNDCLQKMRHYIFTEYIGIWKHLKLQTYKSEKGNGTVDSVHENNALFK